MKYQIINRSQFSIQITIPGHSGRNSAQFVVEPQAALDIYPWAGSKHACKNIAYIHDLYVRGLIEIIED